MTNLKSLLEKAPDADLLREMIGFAAERRMELKVCGLAGAATARRTPSGLRSATAIASATGRSLQEAPQAQLGGVASGGLSGISKSQVSRLRAEIDEKVTAFLGRPIEGERPYLWIEATGMKARAEGRIVSMAVMIAVRVNGDGRRKGLGRDIGPSEAETFWTALPLARIMSPEVV